MTTKAWYRLSTAALAVMSMCAGYFLSSVAHGSRSFADWYAIALWFPMTLVQLYRVWAQRVVEADSPWKPTRNWFRLLAVGVGLVLGLAVIRILR
jgi:hypothetical protein